MTIGRPKTKRKSFTVVTAVEVAEFFGVTETAVSKWRRADDPMPKQRGGYDLSQVAKWMRRQSSTSGLSEELKAADIRLKTVQAQQKELELSVKKRELIPLVDVERWAAVCIVEFREMVMGLPEILAGSSPPDNRNFIRDESERHLRGALLAVKRRLESEDDYLEETIDDNE